MINSLDGKLLVLCTGDLEKNIIVDWSGGTLEQLRTDIRQEIKDFNIEQDCIKDYLDWWYVKRGGKVEKLF